MASQVISRGYKSDRLGVVGNLGKTSLFNAVAGFGESSNIRGRVSF